MRALTTRDGDTANDCKKSTACGLNAPDRDYQPLITLQRVPWFVIAQPHRSRFCDNATNLILFSLHNSHFTLFRFCLRSSFLFFSLALFFSLSLLSVFLVCVRDPHLRPLFSQLYHTTNPRSIVPLLPSSHPHSIANFLLPPPPPHIFYHRNHLCLCLSRSCSYRIGFNGGGERNLKPKTTTRHQGKKSKKRKPKKNKLGCE